MKRGSAHERLGKGSADRNPCAAPAVNSLKKHHKKDSLRYLG
jgi:hypothetical protein